jgi:hypothetical protein
LLPGSSRRRIRPKADTVLADMFENVLEVLDHQFNGRVHIVPTISAEEAKADSDHIET